MGQVLLPVEDRLPSFVMGLALFACLCKMRPDGGQSTCQPHDMYCLLNALWDLLLQDKVSGRHVASPSHFPALSD